MTIIVKEVTKSYGEETVLNRCCFHVKNGSFTAVIGKSGSGKSTLLRLIAGLEDPDEGSVFINGRDLAQLNPAQRDRIRLEDMGLILQPLPIIEEWSVLKNIELIASLQKAGIEKAYRQNLIQELSLEPILHKKMKFLSQGQKQRVCIARALLTKPGMILADEPASSLDTQNTETVLRLLKECQSFYGSTVILATHDLNLAKQADSLCYMEDGKIFDYADH